MRRWCPDCNRVHEDGEACPMRPKRQRKPVRDGRKGREPHRRSYSTPEYQRNRQTVIGRTRGRCAVCGRVIAVKQGGRWVMRGGDVHHIKPLREKGGNETSNLLPLCRLCHARADAERRKRR